MRTITETKFQGYTLFINTINKNARILLIHPIQQQVIDNYQ
ncbi:unknown [Bacteroides sp. CAG:754]|nr:unknown [Bacteroides sp. CAG:754]